MNFDVGRFGFGKSIGILTRNLINKICLYQMPSFPTLNVEASFFYCSCAMTLRQIVYSGIRCFIPMIIV